MTTDPRYLGRAGELRLISEFLVRGLNCAIPEIDEGDDFLVLYKDHGFLQSTTRIQVKTGKKSSKRNFQFSISDVQLKKPTNPDLHYCFIFWNEAHQPDYYFVERSRLYDLIDTDRKLGSLNTKSRKWTIQFKEPIGRKVKGKRNVDISSEFFNLEEFISNL